MPESIYYASTPTFTKAKIRFSWPPIPNPISRRYRRRFYSTFYSAQSPASSISLIETPFDISETIRALRAHRWSYYDGQHITLIILSIFLAIDKPSASSTNEDGSCNCSYCCPSYTNNKSVLPPSSTNIHLVASLFQCSVCFTPNYYRPWSL
jgi:hypothetical protein